MEAWRAASVINIEARPPRKSLEPVVVHCGQRVEKSARSPGRAGRLSVSQHRLDEAKVETLRSWGEGLQSDPREEVRAAGRAITMLVEEIERLNIDLWHARTDVRPPAADARAPDAAPATGRALPPPLPAY